MKRKSRLIKVLFVLLLSSIVYFCMTGCAEEEQDDLTILSLDSQQESTLEENSEEEQNKEESTEKKKEAGGTIYVYVCGAVNTPGVYELDDGARIFEAVEQAGGFKEEAAREYLNLAQTLSDGEQVYVPTEEEVLKKDIPEDSASVESGITSDGKVNINLATKEELMTLSGIGESRAESIIHYRESQGDFQKIEDLMNVDGIKERIYEKIKDSITVTTGS